MCSCRYGDACTAVVTLSAAGVAQTFVLAGDVQPSFAQGFPTCQLSGNTLVATQQEVSLHGACTLAACGHSCCTACSLMCCQRQWAVFVLLRTGKFSGKLFAAK